MPPDFSSTALAWYQRIRRTHPEGSAAPECIDAAFARQARRTPDRAILVGESGYLTYGELSSAAEARAAALRRRSRGGPQAAVGVLLENDAEKIVTYFACLKAGLPYVPLAPHSPAIMEQILARAPLGALVSSRRFTPVLPASLGEDAARIWIEEEAPRENAGITFPEPDPLRTAHFAFTSGTRTGIPRMVATDHVGSMLSHAWRCRLWPFDPARDAVGCNIFGIWDAVPALCRGVPAVLIRDETMRDPFALASAIVRFGITRIMMTPTLLGACLDCAEGIEALRRLRLLVLCGEIAAPAIVQRAWEALPRVRIANLYSTAECHDIAGGELRPGKAVTCGVVADFAEVHLCDRDDPQRLVEVGSPGRILVGGSALARAVHGADGGGDGFVEADLPAPDGSRRRTRVWDTGDLGVFHPGGELEILGRCDSGIKIRGSWVEPGEIEEVLESHPLVRRACVMAETDPRGQTELVAYVVPGKEDLQAGTLAGRLRAFVASRLSPQSVPGKVRPCRGAAAPAFREGRPPAVAPCGTGLARICGAAVRAGRSAGAGARRLQGGTRRSGDRPAGRLRGQRRPLPQGDPALRDSARRHRAARSGRRPLPAPHSIGPGPLPAGTERATAPGKVEPARTGDRHPCCGSPGTVDSSTDRPGDRSDRFPRGGLGGRTAADDPC